MTIDEISRCAYYGQVPSDNMTDREKLLCYELREVYNAVKAGTLTTKQGAAQKDFLVMVYNGKLEHDKWINQKLALYAGAKPAESNQNGGV